MCFTGIEKKMKGVYYFNKQLWYKVSSEDKSSLINKHGDLKNFIVLDVTNNKLYDREEFIESFFDAEVYPYPSMVIEKLDTLKFKVYRKIKIKG